MQRILKIVAVILGLSLMIYLLWQLQLILLYMLIAVVLSFIGRPIVKLLAKIRISGRQIPYALSSMVTLVFMFSILAGLLSLFIPLVVEEYALISKVDIGKVVNNLGGPIENIRNSLARYGLDRVVEIDNLSAIQARIMELLSVADVPGFVGNVFGTLTNLLVAVFSVVFITFFFLKDARLFEEIVLTVAPDNFVPQVKNVIDHSKKLLTRYFVGLLLQVVIVMILATVSLTILGVKNALLIGFFAGAINIIPYLGPFLGALFGIIVAITTNAQVDFYNELLPLIGKVALVFAIIQLLDNFVLQPLIFSNSVSAHPLEIFLVVLSAGTLGGIGGMVIAIPTYTIIRIVAKEFLNEFKIVKKLTENI